MFPRARAAAEESAHHLVELFRPGAARRLAGFFGSVLA
jgi:hypothetical protein